LTKDCDAIHKLLLANTAYVKPGVHGCDVVVAVVQVFEDVVEDVDVVVVVVVVVVENVVVVVVEPVKTLSTSSSLNCKSIWFLITVFKIRSTV
jgi:hypothetical protein